MASLEELRKRLYKEKEIFSERMIRPELEKSKLKRTFVWQENVTGAKQNVKWVWWTAAAILTLAALIFLFLFLFFVFGRTSFLQLEKVRLDITGLKEVKSGSRVSWQVKITNSGRVDLIQPLLIFHFPEGSAPLSGQKPEGAFFERRSLQTLRAGESASEIFDAYVFGGRGAVKEASASLEYRPEGASAIFATDSVFSFEIISSPVSVSFKMPEELRLGQEIEFEVAYTSNSEEILSNLSLFLSFPEGFEYLGAKPQPRLLGKNLWLIGDLKPGESRSIKVRGVLRGIAAETKTFKASIGVFDEFSKSQLPYDEVSHVAVLRSPFLETTILINGRSEYTASPGENLMFEIIWRNNLPTEVKNAVLEAKIGGVAADLRTLRIEGGSYREATKSIVWNASSLPQFKLIGAGESGKVNFSLRAKSNLPLETTSERPKILVDTSLESGSEVTGFEGVELGGISLSEIKVSSKLQFTSRALYFNSLISNSGPLPPKVGEETTYTIIWSLANMMNDLDGVKVKASLPPYVNFKGIANPADTDMVFDKNSGEIEWRVGRVLAGIGFLRPALQIAFQIGVSPATPQIGTAPTIINESEVSGRDTFTDQILTSRDSAITTDLPDDPSVSFSQKKVVE